MWPLVVVREGWKGAWRHVLMPVGANEFDYHDPIVNGVSRSETLSTFYRAFHHRVDKALKGDFDYLHIARLRVLAGEAPSLGAENAVAPYLDLDGIGNLEGLIRQLGKRQRGEIRRNLRRLDERGTVTLQIFGVNDLDAALERLPNILARHTQRWPLSYKAPAFHENLLCWGVPAGLVHVSELRIGDSPISWHIGFFYRHTFYWYFPVYDPVYAPLSPGRVHLVKFMEEVMKKGANVFDFLVGDEPYKDQWTGTHTKLMTVQQVAPGVTSWLRLQGAKRLSRLAQYRKKMRTMING